MIKTGFLNRDNVKKALFFSMAFAINICTFYTVCAQQKLYPNEFNLSEVTLLDGPFKHARDLNIQTLLQYNTDRFAGALS
jgi:hypothetical protein